MRRLPIYLVLDTSESMVGEPIQSVESGLAAMLGTLRKDPYALETAYLSVITFGTTAKQLVSLTELSQFQTPKLVLGSGTALGAGLKLLKKRIADEVQKTTHDTKGDYKPIVFLFTDGEPTDQWHAIADDFLHNRHLQFVVVGCGQDVNLDTLRRMSELVIVGKEANEETYKAFFKWVSASVATASQSIEQTGSDAKISLEKLPVSDDIKVVDETTPQPKMEPNRFVFLHCKCCKTKKFYLMKFVKGGKSSGFFGLGSKDGYVIDKSYPLDDFDTSGGEKLTVSSSQLLGIAPCPYCGNDLAGHCQCGKIHCLSPKSGSGTCPWCGNQGVYGNTGGGFSVGGGGG